MPRKLKQSKIAASFFSKMGPAPPRGRSDRPLPVAAATCCGCPALFISAPAPKVFSGCADCMPLGGTSVASLCALCAGRVRRIFRHWSLLCVVLARVHMYVICFQLVRCWSLARKPQRCQWNISHACLYEAGRVPLSSSSSTSSLIVSSRLVQ